MKVYVLNCSPEVYNLGCAKLANFYRSRGHEVVEGDMYALDWFQNGDLALFSAIFTKDLEPMVQQVLLAKSKGMKVRVGGPAVTMLSDWVEKQTGITPYIGLLPQEIEKQPGQYQWTFTSRGCPRNCPFCLVTQLEGATVVEDDDFIPASNIGDNNILMTSERHQKLVVERTQAAKIRTVDINSGFDCRVFAQDLEGFYKLWSKIHPVMWRFAFDSANEEEPLKRVFDFFRRKGFDRHTVQAYVLCNFPGVTPEEVHYRAQTIIGYGMMPYLMVFRPVDSVKNDYVASSSGWDRATISRMTGYYNQPSIWMKCSWDSYKRGSEVPGVAGLLV